MDTFQTGTPSQYNMSGPPLTEPSGSEHMPQLENIDATRRAALPALAA
ncbi:hypothetical protein KUV51_08045 [Tateyamaria omphalii]|nr:hypothetical protein [Tateyamaria omphalii]MBY5932944.1 hypothetical protein [Tateyamaria omphalii]